jgi:hypothetical protein
MAVFPRKVDHVVFDRGWVRQVVERVRPEVVDRLCLCLHDERGHVYQRPVLVHFSIHQDHQGQTYRCKLSGRGYLCSLSGQKGQT